MHCSNSRFPIFIMLVTTQLSIIILLPYSQGQDLRGSVPKNGPIDFASKNHFSLNSADGKGLIPKY